MVRSIRSLPAGLAPTWPIALACIAAILIDEPLVAAEVVFIALAGECLEAWTFARTQRGIHKLVEVFPRKCWLLRDGQEVAVNTNEVRVGDRVRIKPGQEGSGRWRRRRRSIDRRYESADRRKRAR